MSALHCGIQVDFHFAGNWPEIKRDFPNNVTVANCRLIEL